MPKYNGLVRGGSRGKISDFSDGSDGLDDNEIEFFLDREERVVRMEGDGLTAGMRPRIFLKSKSKMNLSRNREFTVHKCFEDDLSMALNNNESNGYDTRHVVVRGRGRSIYTRLGSYGPNPRHDLRDKLTQVVLADANWYKITIPWGQKFDKDFIINSILNHIAPDTFVPILYTLQEKSSSFYVDDSSTAKKLLQCDNKIRLNDSFRLHVYVQPGYPQCNINDDLKDRLAKAMTKRYCQEKNSLDLSRFHRDPDLADDYFCALFQPFLLTTVLDIATEHIPNLHALNLEGNKFHSFDRLSTLKRRFQNLKILHIGDNKIKYINQIDPIKDLKLDELRLSGNPFCLKYNLRQSDYVSDVRQRFPKLLRLDSFELPPPISFDVVEEGLKIPSSKRSFTLNQEAKDIAGQFLQQYFSIFDNDNRQNLLNAYHEKVSFSLTVSPGLPSRPSGYLGESRNLLRLNDPNRRRKLLKTGRLSVLSAISDIPQTRHDWDSFTMDLSLCTETLMLVTVTGLFKEIATTETSFRYFNRVFAIVPEGTGYCVLNEQLHVSSPTQFQHRRALEKQATTEVSISPSLTEDVKQKMTATLSNETNMNRVWSLKCLTEVEWNYDRAVAAFQTFFKAGHIPAEAFEK
ncbi:nuclear RNA export factor 1-like [Belonocnema kinseyi]|uniref:nuclear RNA export factor 1-like n=1 Tax=Belonocnema kinseyi TaxID=2817044 RepID=UPI00143DB11A|nr:nuclear RNA export factor 1-like [Belonocnema kinseyi]